MDDTNNTQQEGMETMEETSAPMPEETPATEPTEEEAA